MRLWGYKTNNRQILSDRMRLNCIWSEAKWCPTSHLPPLPHSEVCCRKLEHQQGSDRAVKEINVPVQSVAPRNGFAINNSNNICQDVEEASLGKCWSLPLSGAETNWKHQFHYFIMHSNATFVFFIISLCLNIAWRRAVWFRWPCCRQAGKSGCYTRERGSAALDSSNYSSRNKEVPKADCSGVLSPGTCPGQLVLPLPQIHCKWNYLECSPNPTGAVGMQIAWKAEGDFFLPSCLTK